MSFGLTGSTRLTADGVLGQSGKPYRLFSAHWLGGATAPTLVLRNGTADTNDIWVYKKGTAATDSQTVDFSEGILFPSGCFYDCDTTNAVFAVFTGRTEA